MPNDTSPTDDRIAFAELTSNPDDWDIADAAGAGFAVAVAFWAGAEILKGAGVERVAGLEVDPDRAWTYGVRFGGLTTVALVVSRELWLHWR